MSKDYQVSMGDAQPIVTVRHQDYSDGYRAGVEAMRDAAMREFGDVPKRLLDEADTIWEVATRLLEEKP